MNNFVVFAIGALILAAAFGLAGLGWQAWAVASKIWKGGRYE